ncbi:MAG: macro domain-containing protein [Trueperaceae bacterium]|nr:macro domain-containing protein [Trueperaceae bacterium]
MSHTADPRSDATVHIDARLLAGAVPADGGRVPALLRVRADATQHDRPRTPIDLALVLDRSGSMRGDSLAAARRAAHDAVDLLEDGDRVAIVAYESEVEVVQPLAAVDRREQLHAAIDRIDTRGTTALHAGWVEGAEQLADHVDPARAARVVLLTDGLANVGVTDPAAIMRDVAQLQAHGIVTSTVGLGRSFAEDLLSGIAEAGGGRFAYAETPADLEGIMAAELIGIDATLARGVRATFEGRHADVADVLNDFVRDGDALVLPDLVDGLPLTMVAQLDVAAAEPGTETDLGQLRLTWHDAEGARQSADVPVRVPVVTRADYDARQADPEVAAAVAALTAARRRQRAMEALTQGDEATARAEVDAIERDLAAAPDTPEIQRERAALRRVHEALEARDTAVARKRMSHDREVRRKGFDREAFEATPHFATKVEGLAFRRAQREGREAPSRDTSAQGAEAHRSSTPADSPKTSRRAKPASATAWRRIELQRSDGTTGVLRLRTGDITEWAGDAIVNPTNPKLHGTGASVDGAVHRRGGMELTRECRAIGHVDLGHAVVTKGWNLPASYVLHTAVPTYDGSDRALNTLRDCHRAALHLAGQMRFERVAFPAIGTGTNGYPVASAAQVALSELLDALAQDGGPKRIEVVLYDDATRQAYGRALREQAEKRGLTSRAA